MTTNQPRTAGQIFERIVEHCVRREAFFGLIQWDEVMRREHAGYELHIHCIQPATKVFLNGEEIVATN